MTNMTRMRQWRTCLFVLDSRTPFINDIEVDFSDLATAEVGASWYINSTDVDGRPVAHEARVVRRRDDVGWAVLVRFASTDMISDEEYGVYYVWYSSDDRDWF